MNAPQQDKFIVREVKTEEVEPIISLVRKTLDPFEEAGSVLAATYRRLTDFNRIYNGQEATYFVVEEKGSGKLVGGAGFGPFVGLSPSDKIGEIRELVIEKEFRGQGAGKALLHRCLQYAKEQGYSRIYLETTPKMEHAQNLFKRFKFKPVTHSLASRAEDSSAVPCYFMLEDLN